MKKKTKVHSKKTYKRKNPTKGDSLFPMRLNKYVAHCGICSRRKAVDLIKNGLIKINGEIEENPATLIASSDKVLFKDKLIQPSKEYIYILMNKPKDVITSTKDERGRKTVMDLLRRDYERLFPVGRLDRHTTGLLLITNDGDLAQKLTHPSFEIKKVYEVQLDKPLSKEDLLSIRSGLELEDGPVRVDAINFIESKGHEHVEISIHIGRNRIVRRTFEHLGYHVRKLDRTFYAGLTKKDLKRGWYRPLSRQEIIRLKHFSKL